MAVTSAQYLKYALWMRIATPAVAILAAVSCAPPKPLIVTAPPVVQASHLDSASAPHVALRWYGDFWNALIDMNLQSAWILAGSDEKRKLTDAVEAFLGGQNATADSLIVPLLAAKDSTVQKAARITYGALLTAEGNWSGLATYADSAKRDVRDAAGIEAWATAYKGLATTVTFTDSVVTLPLNRSRSGVAIIPVVVNGVTKHFWLDTGSSITIVTNDVAADSHVKVVSRDTLELVTAVGRLPAQAAVVSSLELGGVKITNARAMIVSAAALQLREVSSGLMPQSVDGVIGFEVIRALDLTIDDVHNVVTIRKPSLRVLDPAHPRNLAWFGVPIVTLVSKNGAALHLVLDTGADETFGTRGMARKTNAKWRAAEKRIVRGFGGNSTESGIVIPSLKLYLDNVQLSFSRIFLYEAYYPTMFTLDGTLGADMARGSIVRIDMTNGRLDISGM
jgi:predicted aspartyl protease